ncbi:MAG: sodium:proton antiporter [Alphaproteobacteria bacterium]|nr:sodium:proton antiporter [Alphaproteobacteria bacterium]
MEVSLRQAVAVLAVAMIVAIAARQIRLPYTVGLVVVGAAVALSGADFTPHLTHDLIYDLVLPPLLFEAALTLSWRELVRDSLPLLALAGIGTVVSATVVAVSMMTLLGWPVYSAMLFGALIAATDPVAIIAMFKDNKIKGRMRLLVESESLLNDGAAAVLFVMALAFVQSGGAEQSGAEIAATLMKVVFGGVIVGALFGGVAILASLRTSEHLIEATLTTIAAFGSFLIAEYFHFSGVLATVTAGLVMGNMGLLSEKEGGYISLKGREFVLSFWDFAAFLANSMVFLMIGADVASTPFGAVGATSLVMAIATVLCARAIVVYPLSSLFLFSRWKISFREQHVLWWGGLRGALALALALSLPGDLPQRDEILAITFAVVGFSIVVQGLTMPLLLRALGFLPKQA